MLQIEARQAGTSIAELVLQAAQERYSVTPAKRRLAMQAIVGIWKDRKDLPADADKYIRQLRRGARRSSLTR